VGGGWAQTNLGLYGSSHIGILGAIVERTDIDGILGLDMLATDYYRNDAYPTYLLYNPYQEVKTALVQLPAGNFDIYDAVSNQVIINDVTGSAGIPVPLDASVIIVYIPAGSEITYDLNIALVNGIVIDYNAGQPVTNYPPRIKSLAMADSVAVINTNMLFYCTAEDKETEQLNYEWYVDNVSHPGIEIMDWDVPSDTGYYEIKCKVTDEGGLTDEKSIMAKVVEKINYPPVIESIIANPRVIIIGETSEICCIASDENGDQLTYSWSAQSGNISGSGNSIEYTSPDFQGIYYIKCEVTDTEGAKDVDSLSVLVQDPEQGQTGELVAKYDFDGSAWDNSGNGHNGSVSGCSFVEDFHSNPESAISFTYSSSNVLVQNDDALNFRDGITLCFWLKVNEFYEREQYPISHGNWQNRWKFSIGDEKLRFTINGENGIIDIDTESILEKQTWYHVAAVYNGWTCELYLDGKIDAFKSFDGKINTTLYDLVFGQSLPGQSGFNYSGILDNVRLYNYGISPDKVKEIYENELSAINDPEVIFESFNIFPQPARDNLQVEFIAQGDLEIIISFHNIHGQLMDQFTVFPDLNGKVQVSFNLNDWAPGIYVMKLSHGWKSFSKKVIISQ